MRRPRAARNGDRERRHRVNEARERASRAMARLATDRRRFTPRVSRFLFRRNEWILNQPVSIVGTRRARAWVRRVSLPNGASRRPSSLGQR